jgi:hypothetical protein
MKVIFIRAENDYDALTFEENFKPTPDIWESFDSNGSVQTKEGEEIFGDALEFGDVDDKFIEFIKDKIVDYDASKHTNFFVVKE